MAPGRIVRRWPRILLGLVRLMNGLIALLVPRFLAERLGPAGEPDAVRHYLLRMFGIRTVFLGLDLLVGDEERQHEALRRAPIIHTCDAVAAFVAGASRQLPPRAAAAAFGISCLNLLLSLAARAQPGQLRV